MLGGCVGKGGDTVSGARRLAGLPWVPKSITWRSIDSQFGAHEDRYSIFRTYYFAGNSVVYAFDCINDKKLICVDTSIYDEKTKLTNDTSLCNYEDSILFAVENVKRYRGTYQFTTKAIVCKMGEFLDTLQLVRQGKDTILLVKGEPYIPAMNFKKESYRRLYDLVEPADTGKFY